MSFSLDNYNDVSSRIVEFREKYPEGSLTQVSYELVQVPMYAKVKVRDVQNDTSTEEVQQIGEKTFLIYTAAAYRTPEDKRPGIGTAWEPVPGPTPYTRDSEMQNAETAAWGRAIVAALAADTKKGIASREEVEARRGES